LKIQYFRDEARETYRWVNETILSKYREEFPPQTSTYEDFCWAYTIFRYTPLCQVQLRLTIKFPLIQLHKFCLSFLKM
jgi:hypothetical protein